MDAAGGNVDAGAMFPGCGFVRDLEFEWLELESGTRIVGPELRVGKGFEYRLFRKISVRDRFRESAEDPVGNCGMEPVEDKWNAHKEPHL